VPCRVEAAAGLVVWSSWPADVLNRARYLLITLVLGVMVVLLLRPASLGKPSCVPPWSSSCLFPTHCGPHSSSLRCPQHCFLLIQRGYYNLLTGEYFSTDVTIDQRAFEARTVLDLLSTTAWGQLLGFGPGATVDLTAAPDAGTLAASGQCRDDLAHNPCALRGSWSSQCATCGDEPTREPPRSHPSGGLLGGAGS
jgi:hypothetical protein